ncbi:ATP-binding protein [Acinetobacter radioresistens]|uniref:ATP-binding protein n=1 Tax=Acinetobacter radioresistens TaxID=40216 RepID=UPI0020066F11|nr:ATP-binding protein [Acinetobacter radioresistens]MCK4089909.1 sensor histidine kinase [Acinetobacter radioresistens]MCM1935267.1 ATP-binding protein [Acinetobacter radioresistens]MCM1952893.1 ATP-binding protein [Acinetobacter radioresistens]MCU4308717.1 ATP-binding protein [Acinetobacter radioresistens]MCU4565962.1 ATP-binding protein [Acinetobacter radioresistens]
MNENKKFEFRPRARLLAQLGDQLIKNEHIAVIELIKNSYDADATFCNVVLDNFTSIEDGTITIIDNGNGMNLDILENAWLEPGSDSKLNDDKTPKVSPKFQRLPIGEKGIGRFGVHKLGNVIQLITKKEKDSEVEVNIDWRNLEGVKYLKDVPISLKENTIPTLFETEDQPATGTKIIIKDLKNKWDRRMVRELARTVNSLKSPFITTNEKFEPKLILQQNEDWLADIQNWESVEERALFRFDVTLEGTSIQSFKYEFMPWATMLDKLSPREVDITHPLVAENKSLYEGKEKNRKPINLEEFKIGKVRFIGYIFDLDSIVMNLGITDKKGFKDILKMHTGVKVFRDGLRVYDYGEPENDWLGLDHRRFQSPAKAVSNNLLVSAVQIDRETSNDLQEKTNREGFVENDAYHAFKGAVLHTLDIIETLRLEDKTKLRLELGNKKESKTVDFVIHETKEYVETHVKDNVVKKEIVKYLDKIDSDYKLVKENLLHAAGSGLSLSIVVHEVEKIIYEVQKLLKAEKASERATDLVKHLSSMIDGYSDLLKKSTQKVQSLSAILDQALFNTEFRQLSHNVEVIPKYKEKDDIKIKLSKNLILGSLQNVFDNAFYWLGRKYDDSDVVQGSKKIFIDFQESNAKYHLVIADNGTGFIGSDKSLLTEPFVSYKPNDAGMGLGLHIASQALLANNGILEFPDFSDFEIPEDFKDGAVVVFSFNKA